MPDQAWASASTWGQLPDSLGPDELIVLVGPAEHILSWHSADTQLLPDELARGNQMSHEPARCRFLAGRVLLRHTLSGITGLPPPSFVIEQGPHGKPALTQPAPPLHFNISHSGSLVAVAITRLASVGIDIEQPRPVSHAPGVLGRILSPAEQPQAGTFAATPGSFFDLWTRKEAAVKMLGGRLLVDAPTITVLCDDGYLPEICLPGNRRASILSIRPWAFPDYVAAAAVLAPPPRVTCVAIQ